MNIKKGHLEFRPNEKESVLLLCAGDFCPTVPGIQHEVYKQGLDAAEKLFGNVLPELRNKDLSMCNLECALTQKDEPIVKDGPNIIGDPSALNGLEAAGFDSVIMANNHILDYGDASLTHTLTLLQKHHIDVIGAGCSLEEACQPGLYDVNGLKIGILAFCEHESSVAAPGKPGAAPFEPGLVHAQLQALKDCVDVVIVHIHGGSECCPLPSPRMVQQYRLAAEAGADAVIGHHAHIVQGLEIYKGVPIIYNIGNFSFWSDVPAEHPCWWEGMLVRLHADQQGIAALQLIPVRMDHETAELSLIDDRDRFFARVQRLSDIIADPELYERFWDAYCARQLPSYLERIKENSCGIEATDIPHCWAAQQLNLVRCEAHRDVLVGALELLRRQDHEKNRGVEEELSRLMGEIQAS